MSNFGFDIFQQNINKIIKKTFRVWEEFDFENMSFWEIFQDDFKSFIEKNFKLASIHYLRKFWNYL